MGQIEVVKFGPTEEEKDFRKALSHLVLPQVVAAFVKDGGEMPADVGKTAARLTLVFVDAMIEELEE